MQSHIPGRGHKILLGLLAAFFVFHTLGGIWCVSGGLQAAESDRRHFAEIAQPLKASGDISAAGYEALAANGEKRSTIHAGVMFTYAAVHFVTAGVFAAAFLHVRNRRREAVEQANSSLPSFSAA